MIAAPLVGYAALVAGALANPVWGIAAVVAYCLQPYLVFAGTPLSPRGLHAAALGRLVWGPVQWLRVAFGPRGAYATARAEGATMTLGAAIAYGLAALTRDVATAP